MFLYIRCILSIAIFSTSIVFANVFPQLITHIEEEDVIWGFSFINAKELFYTLRDGRLYYYNITSKKKVQLPSPKVEAEGQGGLLDVYYLAKTRSKLDQDYLYLTFSKKLENGNITTALARGKWENQKFGPIEILFEAKVKSKTHHHYGSRIVIVNQHLFMTIGERGKRHEAQNLSLHHGKILRLNLDGKAASGNPFENRIDALKEIWSYGHRNPQGIDIDPKTNELYSCEFGPRGGDELNLINAGKNYGWPLATYGTEYHGPKIGHTNVEGTEQPIAYWEPSISPSGMAFYDGDKIPEWRNNLFLANLSSTHLRRLEIKDHKVVNQEVLFADLEERIRQVRSSPDGYLYFSTDSGKLIQIKAKEN